MRPCMCVCVMACARALARMCASGRPRLLHSTLLPTLRVLAIRAEFRELHNVFFVAASAQALGVCEYEALRM